MQVFLGVYWSARRESLETACERSRAFVGLVESVSPGLSQWYHLQKGKSAPLKAADTHNSDSLRSLLLGGQIKADMPRELMPELGWGFKLWNGVMDEALAAQMSVRTGMYARKLTNSAYISFGSAEPNVETLTQHLQRMCALWRADEGRLEIDNQIVVAFKPSLWRRVSNLLRL